MAAIECFAFGVCCWKFSVWCIKRCMEREINIERDMERGERVSLAKPQKPQAEPTFLCIFDTVQVTKVPAAI